jgi:hypothetical protein
VAAGSKWPQVFNLRIPRPGYAAPLEAAHARRRTLTAPLVGFVRSVLTRFGILPSLVSKRRLLGTGGPSLALLLGLGRLGRVVRIG